MSTFSNELQRFINRSVNVISGNNIKTVTIIDVKDDYLRGVEIHTGRIILFLLGNIEIVEIDHK